MRAPPVKKHHVFNLLLRTGTSVVIWLFCLGAFLFGTVRDVNFRGVSIACAFILLTCIPSLLVMRRLSVGRPAMFASALDRLLVIVGYTGVLYSLGGIEAGYLIPL
jgi:hypothetical protein